MLFLTYLSISSFLSILTAKTKLCGLSGSIPQLYIKVILTAKTKLCGLSGSIPQLYIKAILTEKTKLCGLSGSIPQLYNAIPNISINLFISIWAGLVVDNHRGISNCKTS